MKTTPQQHWGYGLPDQPLAPRPRPEPAVKSAKAPWLRNLRGDILGGITAAVVTIPVSMGYGLLALAPLGESFIFSPAFMRRCWAASSPLCSARIRR